MVTQMLYGRFLIWNKRQATNLMGNPLQPMTFERLAQVESGFGYQKAAVLPAWPLFFLHATPGCWTLFLFSHCDLWVSLLIKKNLSVRYSELVWDYLIRVPPSDAFGITNSLSQSLKTERCRG